VTFTGWGDCPGDSAVGVALSFVPGCDGRLAGISRYGYPGSGLVEIEICTSYFFQDNDMPGEKFSDQAMLRFIARHVFGHVVGFPHRVPPNGEALDPWISVAEVGEGTLLLGPGAIGGQRMFYGARPSGSLVGPSNRCVGDGLTTGSVCDGSTNQSWQFVDGELRLEGQCLISASGILNLVACPSTSAWRVSTAQWRDYAGLCISVSTGSGSAPVPENCRSFGDQSQTWTFEFPALRRVRIRHSDSGLCVSVPDGTPPPRPVLAPCGTLGTGPDVFETTSLGQLRTRGYCMSQTSFDPCAERIEQTHFISGLVQDGPAALTMTPNGISVADLAPDPGPTQIFDYYF
jgi:hypothetical protein